MKKYNVEQRSDEWYHIRKGKITGTTLKAILGTPKARQEALYELLAERLTVGNDGDENAMERGTRLEPEALAMFELETGKQVEQIGMCARDDNENIAQSPDGYIKGSQETEAVEIKCPGGKNYVKMWLNNQVPDEYEWQVVQYFVVNDKLKTLWFVGYNPDIPDHIIHIIKVTREQLSDKIELALSKEKQFLEEVEELLKKIVKI